MATPAIEADDGWSYGLGLELRTRDGRQEIRHGGSMPGFGATMLGDLDSGLGVAVAVNATDEHDLTEEVAAAILDLQRDRAAPRVTDPLAVAEAGGATRGPTPATQAGLPTAEGDRSSSTEKPLEPRGGDRFLADRAGALGFFLLGFRREDGRVVEAHARRRRLSARGVLRPTSPSRRRSGAPIRGTTGPYNPWYSNFRVVLRGGELVAHLGAWG